MTRSRPAAHDGVLDEHGFAAVLSETPHGGAYRRDAVRAFATAARDGAPAASLERMADLWLPATGAVGVAEPMRQRRDVTPGRHLLGALGPRPLDPDAHGVWRGAAKEIDQYRERWGLTQPTTRSAPSPGHHSP